MISSYLRENQRSLASILEPKRLKDFFLENRTRISDSESDDFSFMLQHLVHDLESGPTAGLGHQKGRLNPIRLNLSFSLSLYFILSLGIWLFSSTQCRVSQYYYFVPEKCHDPLFGTLSIFLVIHLIYFSTFSGPWRIWVPEYLATFLLISTSTILSVRSFFFPNWDLIPPLTVFHWVAVSLYVLVLLVLIFIHCVEIFSRGSGFQTFKKIGRALSLNPSQNPAFNQQESIRTSWKFWISLLLLLTIPFSCFVPRLIQSQNNFDRKVLEVPSFIVSLLCSLHMLFTSLNYGWKIWAFECFCMILFLCSPILSMVFGAREGFQTESYLAGLGPSALLLVFVLILLICKYMNKQY